MHYCAKHFLVFFFFTNTSVTNSENVSDRSLVERPYGMRNVSGLSLAASKFVAGHQKHGLKRRRHSFNL